MDSKITKTELIFKKNIIKYRTQKNVTPYAVAKSLNIDTSNYYRLENPEHHSRVSFPLMEKLAAFYGIPVSQLFQE